MKCMLVMLLRMVGSFDKYDDHDDTEIERSREREKEGASAISSVGTSNIRASCRLAVAILRLVASHVRDAGCGLQPAICALAHLGGRACSWPSLASNGNTSWRMGEFTCVLVRSRLRTGLPFYTMFTWTSIPNGCRPQAGYVA